MKDAQKAKIREIVRKNLIRFRKEKGVTQSEVGAYLGVTKTGVASWEQGRTSPDIETIYLLSKYYRKSLDDFYKEEPVIADPTTSRVLDPEQYIKNIYPEQIVINHNGTNYVIGYNPYSKKIDKESSFGEIRDYIKNLGEIRKNSETIQIEEEG